MRRDWITRVFRSSVQRSVHTGIMRQPTRVLFHCAKMIYGTHKYPGSPHSGLMRQPAKDRSVWDILKFLLAVCHSRPVKKMASVSELSLLGFTSCSMQHVSNQAMV